MEQTDEQTRQTQQAQQTQQTEQTEHVAQIKKNNLFFRQLIFLSVLILIGVVIIKELAFFVGSFLGALTLYIVFREPQHKLVEKYKWKPWMASLLLVAIATLVLAGLLFGVFRLIAAEVSNIPSFNLNSGIAAIFEKLNEMLPFNIVPDDILRQATSTITTAASSIVNKTYSFVINILLMILLLYFMLANSRGLEKKIKIYTPFKGEGSQQIVKETSDIIYSNAIGIPLMMLVQGLTAALIYWLFGLNNIVFWAFITAIAGLIPMVGTIIVSVPLGISVMVGGDILKGLMLMLCGLFIIANVDNLFRIILNKKMTDTHPLIVILGVILGIPLFGFWGIIFGPLLISLFFMLVRLYYVEFKLITPDEATTEPKKSKTHMFVSRMTEKKPAQKQKPKKE